jgi:hypothetical protein
MEIATRRGTTSAAYIYLRHASVSTLKANMSAHGRSVGRNACRCSVPCPDPPCREGPSLLGNVDECLGDQAVRRRFDAFRQPVRVMGGPGLGPKTFCL